MVNRFLFAVLLSFPCPAIACQTYTLTQIADAVRNSPNSSQTMKDNACMWGGAAKAESGGNSCADNGNNYGVLQLTRTNLPSGMSPAEYKNLTLQQQVDIWAQYGGPEKQGKAFNTLTENVGGTINGVQISQGMIAACSQFGGLICKNNLNYIKENGKCQTMGDGGVKATNGSNGTLANGTANLDGNGKSICSWGAAIQNNIDKAGCSTQKTMNCGPGDFPTPNPDNPVAIASAEPPPAESDIQVLSGQV